MDEFPWILEKIFHNRLIRVEIENAGCSISYSEIFPK